MEWRLRMQAAWHQQAGEEQRCYGQQATPIGRLASARSHGCQVLGVSATISCRGYLANQVSGFPRTMYQMMVA